MIFFIQRIDENLSLTTSSKYFPSTIILSDNQMQNALILIKLSQIILLGTVWKSVWTICMRKVWITLL